MLPFLKGRSSQLNQEFAFLPTSPPHAEGGIFELRSYQLKPGTLLEWENTWYAIFILDSSLLTGVLLGEEELKQEESGYHLWVLGSRRWATFTKFIICGNTRMFLSLSFPNLS
jgi:hypothetical protein